MFDLLLLLTVKIILKRKVKLFRIILGALIGSFSIFFLFIPLNSVSLFIFKILISILMILITFGFKNRISFIKNILYLYFISIILGGFLYYLNLEFSYKNIGLVFFHNGFSINFILLIILSPIILYLYIKQDRDLKNIKNYHYTVELFYKNKKYEYQAYLDTGNLAYDPYSHKPVIFLYDPSFPKVNNPLYIPYQTLEYSGLLKAFKADKIILDNKKVIMKPLIAISTKPFRIADTNMLLHKDYLD
jgi:stage II sporulation protein GA (sporulation sigma-E factor processing peptidase)